MNLVITAFKSSRVCGFVFIYYILPILLLPIEKSLVGLKKPIRLQKVMDSNSLGNKKRIANFKLKILKSEIYLKTFSLLEAASRIFSSLMPAIETNLVWAIFIEIIVLKAKFFVY